MHDTPFSVKKNCQIDAEFVESPKGPLKNLSIMLHGFSVYGETSQILFGKASLGAPVEGCSAGAPEKIWCSY